MKRLHTVGILLVLLVSVSSYSFNCDELFQNFVKEFKKDYTGLSQEALQQKKKTVCDTEEKIRKHNSQNFQYTEKLNEHSDLTEEEWAKRKGSFRPIIPEKHLSNKQVQPRLGNAATLDWRNSNIITSIKDQGSCGSCWSFAAAAYGQSRLIRLNPSSYDTSLDLSEQYFLECTRDSNCNGGYMEYTMDQLTASGGVPYESTYPYNPSVTYTGICSASGVRVGYEEINYYNLDDNQLITLLQTEPVAIAVASGGWSSYSTGVFSCASNAAIDHAVLLVGYTETYWIIKNQWGSSWGMAGYIHVSRTQGSNCGIGATAHVLGESYTRMLALLTLFVFALFI